MTILWCIEWKSSCLTDQPIGYWWYCTFTCMYENYNPNLSSYRKRPGHLVRQYLPTKEKDADIIMWAALNSACLSTAHNTACCFHSDPPQDLKGNSPKWFWPKYGGLLGEHLHWLEILIWVQNHNIIVIRHFCAIYNVFSDICPKIVLRMHKWLRWSNYFLYGDTGLFRTKQPCFDRTGHCVLHKNNYVHWKALGKGV